MRVSSPIGDLPFEPTALHLHGRHVEVEGLMGAWPARVVVEPSDLPALLRMVRIPVAVGAAAVAGIALLAIRGRNHP